MDNILWFLAGLALMYGLREFTELRRTHERLLNIVADLKPRANSKEGARIVDALETPKFKLGSIIAMNAREAELLAEYGKIQMKKRHHMEELQAELDAIKEMSTSGWGPRPKRGRE